MFAEITRTVGSCALATAFMFSVGQANASLGANEVPIVNPSFETDVLGDNMLITGASGWSGSGFVTWNPPLSIFPSGVPDGENVVATTTGGSLFQILSTELMPSTDYALDVLVGRRADLALSDYRIELWAGGVQLASSENPATPAAGTFEDATLLYSSPADPAPIGEFLEIRLINFGISGQAIFDDIGLTAASIPGPAGLALFALCGLGTRRRR